MFCILNEGTVPTLCILYVGTVPTLCILYVGTVPTLCILNVGTVPTFSHSLDLLEILEKLTESVRIFRRISVSVRIF